jgi:hypothetical protein
LDVKFLPGWKPNQRVTALNIVDHANWLCPSLRQRLPQCCANCTWNVGFNGQVLQDQPRQSHGRAH